MDSAHTIPELRLITPKRKLVYENGLAERKINRNIEMGGLSNCKRKLFES